MLSARSPTTNWKAMENAKDLGGFRVGGLVGDPGAGGLNVFTSSKSLSMNIESPKFPGTSSNSIIYLYSGSSPDSRIEFTRTSWLGWGVFVKQQLNGPIRDNVFSLSYWGMQGPEDTDLFNNLAHENIYGLYASGNAHVGNCTCDRNDTGLEVHAVSGETLHIRDSLFTANADEGILIDSGAGEILNYYNAFWQNGEDISGGSLGNGSQQLGSKSCPYYSWTKTDWRVRYRLKQTSSVVDAGSGKAADAGLAAYTTATDNTYDTRHVDMGLHFLARPTIWVDASVAPDHDASGTRADPCGTIHHPQYGALAKASPGTTILVLPGRYCFEDEEQVTFDWSKREVHLIGTGKDVTILDGQRTGPPDASPSCPLIKIYQVEQTVSDITLAALTVAGRENEIYGGYGQGGGIHCRDAVHVKIRDCLIADNEADKGGGLYIENSEVTIEDCIIHQNTAISGDAGGGVFIKWCDSSQARKVTIRRSIISNNTAGDPIESPVGGGGIYCCSPGGQGIMTDPLIEDCVISHNRAAAYHGGGIYLDENCPATIVNSIVEHNMATYVDDEPPYAHGRGGAIYLHNCSPVISGCTISNNTTIVSGSGIDCRGGSSYPSIVNCTIVYNTASEQDAAGIWSNGAYPKIVNCIVWGNGEDDLAGCEDTTYSCIGEPHPGEGNIQADPLLVGSIYGPYHLGYGSPCIGAGTTNPSKLPDEYQTPDFDIDGDDRVIGDIDMGSDERHPFRQMVGIRKDYVEDSVVITWESQNGKSYGVYRSKGPFTNYMLWEHVLDVGGTGDPVSWEDTSINFQTEDQRYYKVLDTYAGVWSRPVGFVNADLQYFTWWGDQYSTLFAIPLELKYQPINGIQGHEDESLGSMIAENLEEEDQDRSIFLKLGHPEEGQFWTYLWLKNGKWCYEYTTTECHERFSLGEVFRIVEATGSPSRITFLGYVPSRAVSPMVFRSTGEQRHVEFGYPYPVYTTVNAFPFLRYRAYPWEPEDTKDELWIPTHGDPEQWKQLWLRYVDGKWMDGENEAVSPDIDVVPGKGFRYYGELGVDNEDFEWDIYYRRVPAVRPYRAQ